MIALDTNLLVYAHREDSPWHSAAFHLVEQFAEAARPWAIPWPSLHEFVAVVTNPRVFPAPTPLSQALDAVAAWLESPALVLLAETNEYWRHFRTITESSRVRASQIHDARIAALCLLHGVEELWTADRHFSRFPQLKVRYPLTQS